MDTKERGVVVGVAGEGEEQAAWRWAAQEAERRGAAVTLVHALRTVIPPPPPTILITYDPLFEAADDLVREAADQFATVTGTTAADTAVIQGAAGMVLTELSAEAELIVVGHRRLEGVRRLLTRSTAVAVSAHADCPVAVVPDDSADPEDPARQRWVTVGVHESGVPDPLLSTAFAQAHARGCGVRVLHAWRTDSVYDDIISRRVDPGWQQRVREGLEGGLAPWREKHPDLEVVVEVLHDWPADAMLRASAESELLVLGRNQRQNLPHWLGSVTRSLVRSTRGPLLVVPV